MPDPTTPRAILIPADWLQTVIDRLNTLSAALLQDGRTHGSCSKGSASVELMRLTGECKDVLAAREAR